MLRKLAITLLLISLTHTLAAQSTRVRGSVRDADTGEPIPFAGVYFDGTTIGISTDMDGRFSLETRSPEAKVLTASMIGYESASAAVAAGAFTELEFRLKMDPRQLEAAYVKPDNRYIKSILRKLDRSLRENDPDNAPDWNSRLYTKVEFDVTNMEDLLKTGFLDRSIGFVREYADTSAITGKPYIPVLLSENVSDFYHSNNPAFNREVIRASRISGLEQDNFLRQFSGAYLLKTNFYKPSIGVFNLVIPNPASASSHLFYNYFLVDSLQVEGRKTYVLRFHPKKLVTSPTIDGEMQIDAEDFGIRSVRASLSSSSNVNWIRHINFDIQNRRLPGGRWFYDEERLFIDFSISTSDSSRILSFLGNRHMQYSTPVFEPVTDPDALGSQDAVVARDVLSGDDFFWESIRPFPLTAQEKGIYQMVEEVKSKPVYSWTYGIAHTLIGGYYECKPIGVEFGRYARTFVFNDTEGFRMQLGGRTTKDFSQKVRLGGYFAYAFRDRTPKWEATAEFMFRRDKTRKLTLRYKRDYVQLGSGKGVFTAQNIFSSIFARSHANRQSMVRSIDILYDHEFAPWLNAQLEWSSARLWSNPKVPFYRSGGDLLESFCVNELHATLRFSFDERINRNYFKKTYLFTKYPVIQLEFTGGIKGLTRDDVGYTRTDLTLTWKVPSTAIGFGRLFVQGGFIGGPVPYPLLKLHEGNQTFFMDRTAFSLMNYYEFASDRWLCGYYEHNFNGLILSKIPLVKKLDLREVATVRMAWGTLSDANRNGPLRLPEGTSSLESPYIEVGAGISNILRILRVDAFWRLTHREKKKNFTINLGIDVEF